MTAAIFTAQRTSEFELRNIKPAPMAKMARHVPRLGEINLRTQPNSRNATGRGSLDKVVSA